MMFRLPVDNAGPGAPPGDRGEAPRPRREFENKANFGVTFLEYARGRSKFDGLIARRPSP